MAISIDDMVVRTKLAAPGPRRGDIRRARLVARLAARPLPRLTVLAAPAGFGKSTALGQINEWLVDEGVRVSWLSLDDGDANVKRFLYHLIAAVRVSVPGAAASAVAYLDAAVDPDPEVILPALVNDVGDAGTRVALTLDDYHFAHDERIDAFMGRLVTLGPPNLHLVIGSRHTPAFPLASLRVQGEITELNAADLRFDDEETERFLSHDARGLSRADAATLAARAEGWAAGLKLALLSFDERARFERMTADPTTNLRDVTDYLTTEVLDAQPAPLRAFMLKTSVLSRLCADACMALTDSPDAKAHLAAVARNNLFLVPLDQTDTWYRYHHLFQDFLRNRLRRDHPGELVPLYAKAADWFEAAGLIEEALDYALLAGEPSRIAGLIATHGREAIRRGRAPKAVAWCERVPDAVKNAHPIVYAIEAFGLFHMHGHERVEQLIRILEAKSPAADDAELSYYLDIVRAGKAMSEDDVAVALEILSGVTHGGDHFDQGTIDNIAGYCLAELGRVDAARERFANARVHHQLHAAPFGMAYSDGFGALVDLELGDLAAAGRRIGQQVEGEDESPDTFVVPVREAVGGIVACERNRIDEARRALEATLPMLEKVGHIAIVVRGYAALARIEAGAGRLDAALSLLDRARSLVAADPAGRLRTLCATELTAARLAARHRLPALTVNAAARLDVDVTTRIDPGPTWDRVRATRAFLKARLLAERGDRAQAATEFARLAALARAAGRRLALMDYLACEASAAADAGRPEAADAAVAELIAVSEATGILRPLVETEPALLRRLGATFAARPRTRFARQAAEALSATIAGMDAAGFDLSERECEILARMAGGGTNTDIAHALNLSRNTVKWHLKNVYAKLDVANRTEAVVKAQRAGLLVTTPSPDD